MGQRGAGRSAVDVVARALRLGADALAVVTLAPSCAACGELLDRPTLGPVCECCWHSIVLLTPPLCDGCGDPLPGPGSPVHCPRCLAGHRSVSRARAIGPYDGTLRAIVHALKYEGRRSLARGLAALMRARGAEAIDGVTCAIPVPLHGSRRRRRGFNQAADLARHLGVPVVAALTRLRATATQTDLPAAERHRNVQNAFRITRRGLELAGQRVVLIDDVSTTGATLDACARVLKEAGVAEVRALTAARVVDLRSS